MPLSRTLNELASLARIKGDLAEQRLLARAAEVVRGHQIDSDSTLGPLLENPPADLDPQVLRRLHQLHEAGAWVLVESAIADLPADLRRLYEAGPVTLEQLALLHEQLGVTSLIDLIGAVQTHAVRSVPGLGQTVELGDPLVVIR